MPQQAVKPFHQVTLGTQRQRLRRLGQVALRRYGVRDAKLRFISDTANVVFRVDTQDQRYTLRIDPEPADAQLWPVYITMLHLHNCLLHEGRLCVIDFADCRFASYFYDVAVPLTYLDQREDYEGLRAAFFEGYAGLRPLPDRYETAICTFMVARAFDIIEWIHLDWPSPTHYPFGPALLDSVLRRIRRYEPG